jgi:hypothetical protein
MANLASLVRLSSGYPRIVEALSIAYPEFLKRHPQSLHDALSPIRNALRDRECLLEFKEKDLPVPLLNRKIKIGSKLPSGTLCRARVESGSFICPVSDGDQPEEKTSTPFIPRVPLLPLFLWTYDNQSSPTVKVLYEFMRHCFDRTLEISGKNDCRVFHEAGFEHAHALYLALRALLEKRVGVVKYLTPKESVSKMDQLIEPSLLVTNHFLDSTEPDRTATLSSFLKGLTEKSMAILHIGANIPGFDTLVFEKSRKGVCLSLYQMKYNGPDTCFTAPDWEQARKRLSECWKPYGFQLEPRQVPKVFQGIVLASIEARFDIMGPVTDSLLENNVRGEHELCQLYGPTLFPLVKPGSE